NPQLRQAHRRRRFNGGNRIHAADVIAAYAAGVIDSKGIRVERPVFPAGQLLKIDQQLPFDLALVDRAAANATPRVAQNVVGIDDVVSDAAVEKIFADSVRVAALWQARRNRWLVNTELVGRLLVDWLRKHRRNTIGRDHRSGGQNKVPDL